MERKYNEGEKKLSIIEKGRRKEKYGQTQNWMNNETEWDASIQLN